MDIICRCSWIAISENISYSGTNLKYKINRISKNCQNKDIYKIQSERGLHPQTEFVYDLRLSEDFKPVNQDGEVDDFVLVSPTQLLDLIKSEVGIRNDIEARR